MRTHSLKDLVISGKENALRLVVDFDFYRLGRVSKLSWESHSEGNREATANLSLTANYRTNSAKKVDVSFRFVGVRRCKLPELFPMVFLSEVEVEDVKDAQLEGVRYQIKDYGTAEFEIDCADFEITDCKVVN